MTPLSKTLLWSVAGVYLVIRSHQNFQNPSDSSPLTPYADILIAALVFSFAFASYRNRGKSQPTRESNAEMERPTLTDRVVFRVFGVCIILAGVFLLGVCGYVAWGGWIRVERWPRADATLISKDFSSVGAQLVFQYEVKGREVRGVGSRWGPKKTVGAALESYEPGTIHRISYDPEDPSEVETVLSFDWETLRVPIFTAMLALVFIAGGVAVYRWSYGWEVPSADPATES